MDWVEQAKRIVALCEFQDYGFRVLTSETTKAVYLQAVYLERDTATGLLEEQLTRRWFLSPEMTKSEIVSTVFKCCMTSMEHRTREWFLYQNRAIFMPHYDVDVLHGLCEERDTRQIPEEARK